MAVFDTALTPVSSTPANTSNAALFTAAADSSVLVYAVNIGAANLTVRIGITPSGGSVHWKVFDYLVIPTASLVSLGPWFLQVGDAVTVRTSVANDAVFSLTGVESS
jgi:hypothetical protein